MTCPAMRHGCAISIGLFAQNPRPFILRMFRSEAPPRAYSSKCSGTMICQLHLCRKLPSVVCTCNEAPFARIMVEQLVEFFEFHGSTSTISNMDS